jgi:polysaccharide deacetylase 2 family uncharacterized protein YibQ
MHRRQFIKSGLWCLLGGFSSLHPFSARCAGADTTKTGAPYRIALIIDDIGYSRRRARLFLNLEFPLTFSILPHLPYSARLDAEINDRGHEIMLHQPMEPRNPRLDPGPGALYVGDGSERIEGVVQHNLASVPNARGVNNHMGSRFTCHLAEVQTTLELVRRTGLFFVDSRTSVRSIAYRTARQMSINSSRRDIFLDNVRDETAVLLQLVKARRQAEIHGHAVAIGHPYPETAAAIGRFARSLIGSDIKLVYASDLTAS